MGHKGESLGKRSQGSHGFLTAIRSYWDTLCDAPASPSQSPSKAPAWLSGLGTPGLPVRLPDLSPHSLDLTRSAHTSHPLINPLSTSLPVPFHGNLCW